MGRVVWFGSEPAARIAQLPGRGRGLVATRYIAEGEYILAESALLSTVLRNPKGVVLCAQCLRCISLPPDTDPEAVSVQDELHLPVSPVYCRRGCGVAFCGAGCLSDAGGTHDILCSVGSPVMLSLQVRSPSPTPRHVTGHAAHPTPSTRDN